MWIFFQGVFGMDAKFYCSHNTDEGFLGCYNTIVSNVPLYLGSKLYVKSRKGIQGYFPWQVSCSHILFDWRAKTYNLKEINLPTVCLNPYLIKILLKQGYCHAKNPCLHFSYQCGLFSISFQKTYLTLHVSVCVHFLYMHMHLCRYVHIQI